MSWFSILPAGISFIETWAIRVFVCLNLFPYAHVRVANHDQLLLGALVIAPWMLVIIYDMILYLFRTATYDIPVIGGRARNRPRPRAPSLSERPSGRPRNLTIPSFSASTPEIVAADAIDGLKQRLEQPGHANNLDDDE